MKLTTITQVIVDGVMQGNGGASDEDHRNGFVRGGWAMGAGDGETRELISQTYQRADAFLFGRRTYELFASSWGGVAELRAHPIGAALAARPKYVVSTTLTEPGWAGTTVLSEDVATAIGDLKAEPGGDLQVHGSGALVRWLLQSDLVNEVSLIVVPVVLGQGMRLFPESGPDIALELIESRTDTRGVATQVSGQPAARVTPPTEQAAPEHPGDRFRRRSATRDGSRPVAERRDCSARCRSTMAATAARGQRRLLRNP